MIWSDELQTERRQYPPQTITNSLLWSVGFFQKSGWVKLIIVGFEKVLWITKGGNFKRVISAISGSERQLVSPPRDELRVQAWHDTQTWLEQLF